MTPQKVALLGANGQIGNAILHALFSCKEQAFDIIAFIPPNSSLKFYGDARKIAIKDIDLAQATIADLVAAFAGASVLVSALGGKLLSRQGLIQDAAEIAGVRRFYPSEFGMHHVVQMPNHDVYIHPTWAQKIRCLDSAIKHPAIKSGQMTYTVIGCGEFYDLPQEIILCPWLQNEAKEYTLQVVGDPDALMDYSSVHDTAAYLVSSICHPDISENRILGFRSDHISYNEIAKLLERHSGKPVRRNFTSIQTVQEIIENPSTVPEDFKLGSTFTADFWLLLRYVQGQGIFWRPPGQIHNDLFRNVTPMTFDQYFSGLFESKV
ncbi:hypothetical protein BBP40_005431 [Aspergillus hancockii]|nr:hypothetical protein BBP40_005431 [Aspergillus hancockii]